MDNKGVQLLEQRLDYFEQSPEGCNWRVSFEESELNDLKSLLNKYKELDKDNNDLRRLYRRTAIKLQESGKHELAEYFLAQINEIPTFFVEDDIDYYSEYYRLLNENKGLKAENEQYKKQFENIKNNILVPSITEKNFIPISVIQNKIEWLKLIADNGMNAVRFACSKEDEIERIQKQKDINTMINILQELIKEGNKSNE